MNLILQTDSYKTSHYKQYPPGTTNVFSYFESRGGRFKETVFFGLQYFLKTYLCNGSQSGGRAVSLPDVFEAQDLLLKHFGQDIFNYDGWSHIVEDHGGRLPLSIKAVPEGSVIPVHNVLMTVENTCPQCFWLTNFVETLLAECWYPITVATQSREIKKTILKWLELTGDPAGIDFKLHDFGFRGVSSPESAGIGGAAHLVNFKGTDTLAALLVARDVYANPCAGFSIPASEHSTITSWGREREQDAYDNMAVRYPDGLMACVSDSYDILEACRMWSGPLKDAVMARQGTLVIRPDSGYPPVVIRDCLEILGRSFGSTVNAKGYKVLDPHVRLIWGDGVDENMIELVLLQMEADGWSADNIAFGMGGALLQKLDRDTNRFAYKCSSVVVDGVERDVFKQPMTDTAKNSKPGRLMLRAFASRPPGSSGPQFGLETARQGSGGYDILREVFRDGRILIDDTFDQIRERAALAPIAMRQAA